MNLVAPLRIVDQELGRWPEVCAKTGALTTITVGVEVVDRPGWPWLLVPFNLPAALIARALTGTRSVAHIPMSPAAFERHRHGRWISTAMGTASATLFVLSVLHLLAALLVALALGASAAGMAHLVDRLTWVIVSRGGDGCFYVRRVSQEFQRAAVCLDRKSHEETSPVESRVYR